MIFYFSAGNGVGVCNALSHPESEEQRLFASYLVNGVAGVKLIVIFLLALAGHILTGGMGT